MCRFAASRNPPPSCGQQGGGVGPDFFEDLDWFDAIDVVCDAGGPTTASSDSQASASAPIAVLAKPEPLAVPPQQQLAAPAPHCDLLQLLAERLDVVPAAVAAQPVPASFSGAPAAPVAVLDTLLQPAAVAAPCAPAAVLAIASHQQLPAAPSADQLMAALPPAPCAPPRHKVCVADTPYEVPQFESMVDFFDDPTERMKQRRRESAQRSRARKNAYIRHLELENQRLKGEVSRLQQQLAAAQLSTGRAACAPLPNLPFMVPT